ncbi:hypothetical protein CMO92_01820 [Candidatus Woesearchaeota archaeon]|nr:hypothetical protein [Candidatus Woesearchaeota archaeon]|tara:strand:- start:311 stop:586 length:276 start_codon:yes stop_codon:yes gene_type:complete
MFESPERAIAGMLIEKAERWRRGKREPGFKDNKMFCKPEDITALVRLDENVHVVKLNEPVGDHYIHEVIYRGYWFQAATQERDERLEVYIS